MINDPDQYFSKTYPGSVPSADKIDTLPSLTPEDNVEAILNSLFYQLGQINNPEDIKDRSAYIAYTDATGQVFAIQHAVFEADSTMPSSGSITIGSNADILPEGLKEYAGKTILVNLVTGEYTVDGTPIEDTEAIKNAMQEAENQIERYEASLSQAITADDVDYQVDCRLVSYGNSEELAVYGSITPAYEGTTYFSAFYMSGNFTYASYLTLEDDSNKWASFMNENLAAYLE